MKTHDYEPDNCGLGKIFSFVMIMSDEVSRYIMFFCSLILSSVCYMRVYRTLKPTRAVTERFVLLEILLEEKRTEKQNVGGNLCVSLFYTYRFADSHKQRKLLKK